MIFYGSEKSGLIYYIDFNHFLDQGACFFNQTIQDGLCKLNKIFTHNPNINIPELKKAFDISKPTFLDISRITLDNTGTWDKIIKNPRPIIFSGLNLHSYYAPFLGISLAIITIIFNNGLGLSETIFKGFNFKYYANLAWNNRYINSLIENFNWNFTVFSSSTNNSNELDENNDNNINENESDTDNNNQIIDENAPNENNINNIIVQNLGTASVDTTHTLHDFEFIMNNNLTNRRENPTLNLMTGHIPTFVGRSLTFNWNNRSSPVINVENLDPALVDRLNRDDTSYDHYTNFTQQYIQDESFTLTIDYGTNRLSENFAHIGNIYRLHIYDFYNNYRALNFHITFLETEILTLRAAQTSLFRGDTNIVLVAFNGEIAGSWTIRDINHLIDMYQDFDTQINRKILVLGFLRALLSYMEYRA
jgi:hypothetical protein